MNRLIWIVLAIFSLLWSIFCWFAATLLGTGAQVVASITRWLGFDPSSTQWLGDTLAMIAVPAQIIVAIGWLIGMAVLAMVGVAGSRAASGMQDTFFGAKPDERQMRDKKGGRAGLVEGTVSSRHVESAGRDDAPLK
ncbi:MAG: hypothetical protein WCZ66_02945 [Sphingomonadaceae bacterium]